MAVPKKRKSYRRTRNKRAHLAFSEIQLHICKNCGAYHRSHFMCKACGYYNGKII